VASTLLALATACDDPPEGGGVGTGGRPTPATDGGMARPTPRSPRPDGGPRLPEAQVELELPFGAPPTVHRIEVEADLSALDVHFSIDTTQSIAAEIDALQADLRIKVVPELAERVPDVSFGVSHFEDFPERPFGFAGDDSEQRLDTPFELLTPITSDLDAVATAVARLDNPLGLGGDWPESGFEALWQIATGEGYRREADGLVLVEPFDGRRRPGGGTLGGVGFRSGALHVVVHVTDAQSHTPADYAALFPGTHGRREASDALEAIGARVVGIVSSNCEEGDDDGCGAPGALGLAAREDLEQLAVATGAVAAADGDACPHGIDGDLVPARDGQCPLVFDIAGDGSGLADTIVDAIVELVDGIRFQRIHAVAADDPLGFVRSVTPVQIDQPDGAEPPELADLMPEDAPDGVDDSFVDVRARARLGFDVELHNGLIVREETLRLVVPASTDGSSAPRGADAGTATGDEDAGSAGLAAP